ncbi:YicC/YloC family endoribonuclease [Pontibacillus halophilus]|nr:YicC/YloC family endoribonuclease [Pontibacillus halophilus]
MTGYGRGVKEMDGAKVTVEIRSVNHRFFEASIKASKSILYLEDEIKQRLKSVLSRGRIDVYITIEGDFEQGNELEARFDLMDQYIKSLQIAKGRYNLVGDISIQDVTRLSSLFVVHEREEWSNFETIILESLEQAMVELVDMRRREGESIHRDFSGRLYSLGELLMDLESRREVAVEETRESIRSRLADYVKEVVQDEARLLQEVALLAEKGDIAEEITRMFSHLEQFKTLMDVNEPVGRRLDFIIQEMHREVNTIGSKANDVKIGEWTIQLKSIVEKLKEQTQNVE